MVLMLILDLSFVYDTDHNNSEIKQESFLRGTGCSLELDAIGRLKVTIQ